MVIVFQKIRPPIHNIMSIGSFQITRKFHSVLSLRKPFNTHSIINVLVALYVSKKKLSRNATSMLRIFQPYKVTSVLVAAHTGLPLDFQERQNKISSLKKIAFGYGESNPELPRSEMKLMKGGNVSRYTIPDDYFFIGKAFHQM